ncbi:MAG: hypothetical protein HY303_05950 [Candidatus Wallbacteria bacterium]|nr:hypothetical protein [Candidatus Wallbacteria bacterium]
MHTPLRPHRWVSLLLVLCSALAGPSSGQNLPLPLADRVQTSDLIALAIVETDLRRPNRDVVAGIARARREARTAPDAPPVRVPHRVITASLEKALKGKPDRPTFSVLYGMEGWQYTLKPVKPGARVVLFARREGNAWVLVNEPYGAAGLRDSRTLSDGATLGEIVRALNARRAGPSSRGSR